MKICSKCGAQNQDDANFCTTCGTKFDESEPVETIDLSKEEKVIPNRLNVISRVFAIIAAVITLFAYSTVIAIIGLTISVVSISILAIGYLRGEMVGRLRINLFLNIYSFLANFIWLAYSLWIGPVL